jgi:hypothetical protein
LPKKATKVTLELQDIEGKKVGELEASTSAGLHKLTWNTALRVEGGGGGGFGGGGGGGGGGRLGGFGRQVPAGSYRVVLNVDGQSLTQSFVIEGDPSQARNLPGDEEEDDDGDR